jgi:hypothetical protein
MQLPDWMNQSMCCSLYRSPCMLLCTTYDRGTVCTGRYHTRTSSYYLACRRLNHRHNGKRWKSQNIFIQSLLEVFWDNFFLAWDAIQRFQSLVGLTNILAKYPTMYYPVQMESVLKDSWSWKFKIEYYFSSAWVVDVIFDVVYKMTKRHREQMFRRNLSSTSCLEAYETTKGWGLSEGFEAASVCLDRQMAIDDGSFYINHIGSCSADVINLIILHKPD